MTWLAECPKVLDVVRAVLTEGRDVVDLELGTKLLLAKGAQASLLLLDGLADVVWDFKATTDAEAVELPESGHRFALAVVDELQACQLGKGHACVLKAERVIWNDADSDLHLLLSILALASLFRFLCLLLTHVQRPNELRTSAKADPNGHLRLVDQLLDVLDLALVAVIGL